MNTSKPSKPDLSLSISQLKSKWLQLSDVDRAHAVAAIRRSGVFIREIARGLDSNDSNLRRLLKTLDASLDDQDLARRKQISTNELIRRGQATKLQRAERQRETTEIKRTKSAHKGADLICNWIAQMQLHGPSWELIIEEVRRKLDEMERAGFQAPVLKRRDLKITQIIELSRPAEQAYVELPIDAFYVMWLLIWVCAAFPEAKVRDKALDLALARQMRR